MRMLPAESLMEEATRNRLPHVSGVLSAKIFYLPKSSLNPADDQPLSMTFPRIPLLPKLTLLLLSVLGLQIR